MREFDLEGFAAHVAGLGVAVATAQHVALEEAAGIVEHAAKAKFGEYQDQAGPFVAWAELADSTKADRISKGYPEDEPLLREGTLRDSIEHQAGAEEAVVGSNSDILVYQELGTAHIPPRSTLGGAAAEKSREIADRLGARVTTALIGGQVHAGLLPIT